MGRDRRRDQAREARLQWEQAIADGRAHAFVGAKWDSYRALAGDELRDLEREASAGERYRAGTPLEDLL